MMDRTIITLNLTLSSLFLIVGLIVTVVSDHTIGAGLFGVAAGLALGTGTKPLTDAVGRITNGKPPDRPATPI